MERVRRVDVRKGVQETIRGSVSSGGGAAENAIHGRERNKQALWFILRQVIESPRAGHPRMQRLRKSLSRLLEQQAFLKHAGEVNDAA
jgi:hypothetical protein